MTLIHHKQVLAKWWLYTCNETHIFSSPATVSMDTTTSSELQPPTDSLPSSDPGVIAGEYTMSTYNIIEQKTKTLEMYLGRNG